MSLTLKRKETDLYQPIIDYLTMRGCYAWRNNVGGVTVPATATRRGRFVRFGVKGMADVLAVMTFTDRKRPEAWFAGRLVAIEVKRPGESLTAVQRGWLAMMEKYNVLTIVATSVADVARGLDNGR